MNYKLNTRLASGVLDRQTFHIRHQLKIELKRFLGLRIKITTRIKFRLKVN
ncbi:hypothetical protein [Pedobacter arcticus]|uniref:hypothetical protein n=1 Tax=Pedobacter arcticus TaxID=752140 RepID=UPI00030DEB00|nr:hypothetical protein [Pedobacter arcticus]